MFIQSTSLTLVRKKIIPLSHIPKETERHDITNRIKLEHLSMKRVIEKQRKRKFMLGFTATEKLPISVAN